MIVAKQRNKFAELENEKVAAIDIDGVISLYPKCWCDFVNEQLMNEPIILAHKFTDLNQMKTLLGYNTYKRYKKMYRSSGYKRTLPVRENASRFTKELKKLGYTILLLTARPFQEYKNLFKDTIVWLENNNIEYDGIIWGKDKHIKVLQEVPHLKFMVEDNAYNANLLCKWGYKSFLLNNEYNTKQAEEGVICVDDLMQIVEEVKKW